MIDYKWFDLCSGRAAVFFTATALTFQAQLALAFQIGAVGPKLEARLTREPESSLYRAASRLGRLVKSPVHEEITQIGFDCPADLNHLEGDKACSYTTDYADAFIMYGVRWNDMPPFRLNPGQGSKCKKYGILDAPACRTDQTVRFSTQPDCWLCLFNDAEAVSQSRQITGCDSGEGFVQGTLMTRSHFGDLQFLHAMANTSMIEASATRVKILDWAQFAWRVFDEEFVAETLLKDIDIPTIKAHFGCSNWSVSDLYVLGAKDVLNRRLPDIAFGSIVHTVQDSFAAGHTERDPAPLNVNCEAYPKAPKPGPIVEFHAYGLQDGHKHDLRDERDAMAQAARDSGDAIQATRQLFDLYYQNRKWADVRPYFECVFDLSPNNRPASAGVEFVRGAR